MCSCALAADSTFTDTTAASPKKFSILPVPVVGYAPETRWVVGFVTGVIARFDTARPSTFLEMITYSQNDQFRLYLNPDIYLGPWHSVSEFELRRWPDSYWGIGNHTSERQHETYTARTQTARLNLQKKLSTAFGAGVQYSIESVRLLRVEPGRDLDLSQRRRTQVSSGPSGLGFYDTRDNIFAPEQGVFCQGNAGLSRKFFGATNKSQSGSLDLRTYRRLYGSHVLAVQGYGSVNEGDPIFTSLPAIGNEYRLRGYPYGRFRDRYALTAQLEYRFPILWHIRGALFAGAGDVARKPSLFARADFKHSLGGGLRWVIFPKDKVALRLDVAYGQHSDAFYLSLNEAF